MVGTFLDDSELIYQYKISNKYKKIRKQCRHRLRGKNQSFFVHLYYYMQINQKKQGLFSVFIAKIFYYLRIEIIAFNYGQILLKIFFMTRHTFIK